MAKPILWLLISAISSMAYAECDYEARALKDYENEILRAAETHEIKKMAAPLACILQMQTESDGMARYLSSSFLRPLLGGAQTAGLAKDPRYKVVSEVLEQLALRSADPVQQSFVTEFAKGDWRFYTLFCEQGNTQYCSVFLPDEQKVKNESPILAAASMMRLQKAYQVLKGTQRELVAERLKNLYRDIPHSDPLKRKFIDQIYQDLFKNQIPISMLG